MQSSAVCALLCSALLCYLLLTGASYAAENGKENSSVSALTFYQLGDYSLNLDTDEPCIRDVPDPPGLITRQRETMRPFLGLKLSRPLPDNFWNFQQAPTPTSDLIHGLY